MRSLKIVKHGLIVFRNNYVKISKVINKKWKTCNLFRSVLYKQKTFELNKTPTFLPPELLNFGKSNTSRTLSLFTLRIDDNGGASYPPPTIFYKC